jgi:hypothetical protein
MGEKLAIRSIAILLLLCLVSFACGTVEEGEPPNRDLEGLLHDGKAYLAEGNGNAAHDAFIVAQSIDPASTDAAFGIALSNVLLTIKIAEGAVELILSSTGLGETEGTTQSAITAPDQGIGDTIQTYLESIFGPVLDETRANLNICNNSEKFRFETERVLVLFGEKELLSFEGSWDEDDLVWLDGMFSLVEGGYRMLLAVDLNFDARHFTSIDFDVQTVGWLGLLDDLIESLFLIFHDPRFPNFFLLSERSSEMMPDAGVRFGFVFRNFVRVQQSVKSGWGDPTTGIFTFVDDNGDGRRQAAELYTLNGTPVAPSQQPFLKEYNAVAWNLRTAFFDESEFDEEPDANNPWNIADLNLLVQPLTGLVIEPFPDAYIDLGGYFANPDPSEMKAWIGDLLYCAHNERGLLDAVWCFRDRLVDILGL